MSEKKKFQSPDIKELSAGDLEGVVGGGGGSGPACMSGTAVNNNCTQGANNTFNCSTGGQAAGFICGSGSNVSK